MDNWLFAVIFNTKENILLTIRILCIYCWQKSQNFSHDFSSIIFSFSENLTTEYGIIWFFFFSFLFLMSSFKREQQPARTKDWRQWVKYGWCSFWCIEGTFDRSDLDVTGIWRPLPVTSLFTLLAKQPSNAYFSKTKTIATITQTRILEKLRFRNKDEF